MDNRTKRLYIVVPLLWVVLIGAAAGIAYVRHSPVGDQEPEDDEERAPAALVEPAAMAGAGAWGMSLEPKNGPWRDLPRANEYAYVPR